MSMAKKYWDSYREEIYSLVADGGMIDQMYEYLYESGMANAQLWPYRENGFEREVSMLKTWMTNRLNWLDKQFASLQTVVDSIGCFEYGLTTEFTLDGRTLYIWCDVEEERYPYAEIYVDGKKQSAIVLHKNGSQVTLPGDVELYPESVIQVRIYDYYGERIASNYLDLRQ